MPNKSTERLAHAARIINASGNGLVARGAKWLLAEVARLLEREAKAEALAEALETVLGYTGLPAPLLDRIESALADWNKGTEDDHR